MATLLFAFLGPWCVYVYQTLGLGAELLHSTLLTGRRAKTGLIDLDIKCVGRTVHPVVTNPQALSARVQAQKVTLEKCCGFCPTS